MLVTPLVLRIQASHELVLCYLSAKEQEVTSLKKQIESQRKNDLRGGSELDEQLKKAKKTAFVARGNVTKKNLEISHLKNAIQSSQG